MMLRENMEPEMLRKALIIAIKIHLLQHRQNTHHIGHQHRTI